jgi:hypothetical protein
MRYDTRYVNRNIRHATSHNVYYVKSENNLEIAPVVASHVATHHWCDCLRIHESTFPSQISGLGGSQIGEFRSATVEVADAASATAVKSHQW